MSVVGSSITTSQGYYISQSIGQLSITGFSNLTDKSILQGYQQPVGFKTFNESIEIETLQLYPIPVSNKLNLQFSISIEGRCLVEVFDPLGRLVLSKNCLIRDFKSTISLSNLSATSYIIKVTNNSSTYYEKIIKKD